MKPLRQNRRRFLATMAAVGLSGAFARVHAQNAFPNRPVKLYVGASAGGAPDAVARTMGNLLAERWGYPVVIDNKPGLSGFLAAEFTAQAPPDGHSLCLLLDTVMNTLPLLSTTLSIDPITQLKPIGMVGSFPLVVVANPSVKFRDLKQLVMAAKADPAGIDVGSSGVGSSGHVATEIFARTAGSEVESCALQGRPAGATRHSGW